MNLRIRIADDEELIRKSLVKLLKAEGYEVDAVGTAAEVLESVRNDPGTCPPRSRRCAVERPTSSRSPTRCTRWSSRSSG
ncbi:MAG: response regulator [Candidatus Eisenbacteria bacterium]|uniref:Response regulator n=1 Tax=Eiseniibacteriota bacterium TaxID=2212470 RepID=A0A538TF12_UNCEI|nr:MAG: response regulator [Candidatus Eisenbacteria bacterium]